MFVVFRAVDEVKFESLKEAFEFAARDTDCLWIEEHDAEGKFVDVLWHWADDSDEDFDLREVEPEEWTAKKLAECE